ncbi:MAG: SAF domain-containing protein [Solirubrobacterales bacterium]|nr:SAF domain-containing protein [Solirubrobacterales bacterium]
MKRYRRQIVIGLLSLAVGLWAEGRMAAREAALRARIGPVTTVATVKTKVEAGTTLSSSNVALVEVPTRWAAPGVVTSEDALAGLVTTVDMPAGSLLGPGTTRPASGGAQAPLGLGERVATVEAVAPLSLLKPGGLVDVLVMMPGRRPRFLGRRMELLGVRRALDQGAAGGPRVVADLRASISSSLALAGATSAGAELRLLPLERSG